MAQGTYTLQEIANTEVIAKPKDKSPKFLRGEQINLMGDWFIWNQLAYQNNLKELSQEKLETEMLLLVKEQFINGSGEDNDVLYLHMARMLSAIVRYRANERVAEFIHTNLHKCLKKLEEIEKVTNKGGRPPNQELFDISKNVYDKFCIDKGRSPTSGELSRLVDIKMVELKGKRKIDKSGMKVDYLTKRTARETIKKIKLFYGKDSRQELVNSYAA